MFTATSRELADLLRVSEQTLLRMRKAGLLRPGTHFMAIGCGKRRPQLRWNPAAVEATLSKRARRQMPAT